MNTKLDNQAYYTWTEVLVGDRWLECGDWGYEEEDAEPLTREDGQSAWDGYIGEWWIESFLKFEEELTYSGQPRTLFSQSFRILRAPIPQDENEVTDRDNPTEVVYVRGFETSVDGKVDVEIEVLS